MSATIQHSTLPSQHPSVKPPDTPLLLAVPDAARLLGIGTTLTWDLVRAGAIPSVKLGRRVLIPRAALECLAQSPILAATAHDLNGDIDTPRALVPPATQGRGGEGTRPVVGRGPAR